MPGFNIFTSNSLEILAGQLAEIAAVPLHSPLAGEVVVIQSRGMERWLSMEIAEHNGICANVSYLFPNYLLHNVFRSMISDLPETSFFESENMTFAIMQLLPECFDRPSFKSIKTYLEDGEDDLRLFQISGKIAYLFEQYLIFRPEMILGWEEGRGDLWQAQLWREIVSVKGNKHSAWLKQELIKKIRTRPNEICSLPQRISIFGISYLPPFHMEVFAELSCLLSMNFFLLNPCREYWGEIVSEKDVTRIENRYAARGYAPENLHLDKGNSMLASMGTLGRDFFELVNRFDSDFFEEFHCPDEVNILSAIQSDIFHLREGTSLNRENKIGFHGDDSVQIHSCHSPLREMEVLYDNLLAMFEEDSRLLPKDIIVMAPDINTYAPFIHAVFDSQPNNFMRIPFSIADRSPRKESSIIDVFMSILSLKESRLGITEVMDLLESPVVRDKFCLTKSDLNIIWRWINDTNIKWGKDSKTRIKFNLPGFDQNTWKAGIERLLLGYAMPGYGMKMFSGILPYDNLEGADVIILGKFLDFLDKVFECTENLDFKRTLSGWSEYLSKILEQFIAFDDRTGEMVLVIRRLLHSLASREESAGFDKSIDLSVIISYFERIIEKEYIGSGFISGGVTFCSMLPMRSIPFKIICLAGMNNDAFPRDSEQLGFDLMAKNPKPLDRSKRNDDKYLFLEAIISAKKKLYISYVGQSIRDNTQSPPSVLVSELAEYIENGLGIHKKKKNGRFVTNHRLFGFSPEYFTQDSALFSYSEENYLAAKSFAGCDGEKKPQPFISSELSLDQENVLSSRASVDIEELSDFFSNPSKLFMEKRFGIYLYDKAFATDEREKFTLDNLDKYIIGRSLFNISISGLDLNRFLPIERAKGDLPHGKLGDLVYKQMSVEADSFAATVLKLTNGESSSSLGIDIDISGFKITGRLPKLFDYGLVTIRYGKTRPKDIIKSWIYHLVLCLVKGTDIPRKSFLVCKDNVWEFAGADNFLDILGYLVSKYRKGLSLPLHFFPDSSFEYASKVIKRNEDKQKALNSALSVWKGSDYKPGESEDLYYRHCFGKSVLHENPLDDEFQVLSEEIFTPIFEHCSCKMLSEL